MSSPAARFNIFILNHDIESPLGHLLPSLDRKVETPGNLLLKYKWDQCHNARSVAVRCQEGGERMRKCSTFGPEDSFEDSSVPRN